MRILQGMEAKATAGRKSEKRKIVWPPYRDPSRALIPVLSILIRYSDYYDFLSIILIYVERKSEANRMLGSRTAKEYR